MTPVQNGKNVPVEDLNTGPDTTENINEVVERAPVEEQDPETERISKAMERMKWRNRNNFRDVDVTESPDRGTLENPVKITYKKPTEMESERFKYIPDPDDPRKVHRVTYKDKNGETGDVGVRFEPVDGESLGNLVKEAREHGCPYVASPGSDEKLRRASTGFTEEKQTDSPGAEHGEQWLRDSGDVMFGVDGETPGERVSPGCRDYLDRMLERDGHAFDAASGPIDGLTECTREETVDKETEQCNKNVSHPADYYRYGRILERMDDTHRRKNSDYGDAAYKGYKKFGDYYFMVQLHNKYQRLESLTIGNKSQQVEDESIDDTLLDMANYAVMYLESRHRND